MAVEHLTMRERTYNVLIEMIVNGELAVGQQIDEGSLAQLLNVSRTPLREALRQLVIEGLVDSKPYRGYAIRQLSLKEVDDLYKLRKELEVLAIREAVGNMGDEDLAAIERLLDSAVAALENYDMPAYADVDKQFHALIAELSRNALLIDTLNRIGLQVQLCRVIANTDADLAERAEREREDMLDALRNRDPERAGALMRAHISNVQNTVLEQLAERDRQSTLGQGNVVSIGTATRSKP